MRISSRKPLKAPTLDDLIEAKKSVTELLDDIDLHLLEDALDRADNNVAEAARLLGVSRGAVQGKMRKYGIEIIHHRKAG